MMDETLAQNSSEVYRIYGKNVARIQHFWPEPLDQIFCSRKVRQSEEKRSNKVIRVLLLPAKSTFLVTFVPTKQ